jgi:hypothetical protein
MLYGVFLWMKEILRAFNVRKTSIGIFFLLNNLAACLHACIEHNIDLIRLALFGITISISFIL